MQHIRELGGTSGSIQPLEIKKKTYTNLHHGVEIPDYHTDRNSRTRS